MTEENTGDEAGVNSPHLDDHEQEQAAENTPLGPLVIHELVRDQGRKELQRPVSGLAWSALGAGLSICFSFVLQSHLMAALPDAPWARMIDSFGYCIGFLIVVLGQQQLFTETTLTALIPALTERRLAAFIGTLRVWGIVLAGNLIGTWIFAAIIAQPGIFQAGVYHAMDTLSAATMAHDFGRTMITAAGAGWLIGLMVWLLPGSGPARTLIIIILTYAVSVCEFPHIVAGSVEAAYGVFTGHAGAVDYLWKFFLPTMLGNTLGGTALVALINHAQIAEELKHAGSKKRKEATA